MDSSLITLILNALFNFLFTREFIPRIFLFIFIAFFISRYFYIRVCLPLVVELKNLKKKAFENTQKLLNKIIDVEELLEKLQFNKTIDKIFDENNLGSSFKFFKSLIKPIPSLHSILSVVLIVMMAIGCLHIWIS